MRFKLARGKRKSLPRELATMHRAYPYRFVDIRSRMLRSRYVDLDQALCR